MADTTNGTPGAGNEPPEPQGHFAGVPYDWRMPTPEKFMARWWNPNDKRVLTPRAFGWGYDLNLYWLTHPRDYLNQQGRPGRDW